MTSSLSEHHGALSLFGEAIVGRPVSLEPADEPCWPRTATDPFGSSVLAPGELDLPAGPARRRYRAIVLHQLVALEERSGLELDAPAMRRRHPWLPVVFAILEDRRVDAVTRRRYPGGAGDLDAALADAIRGPSVHLPGSIGSLRHRSLQPGEHGSKAPGDVIGLALVRVDPPDASIADTMAAAIEFCDRLDVDGRWIDAGDVESESSDSVDAQGAGASMDRDGTIGRVEQRNGVSGGDALDLDGAADWGRFDERTDEEDDSPAGFDPTLRPTMPGTGPATRTFVYDEWDFRANRHLRSWCRLVERRLEGDNQGFLPGVRQRHAELRADIQRRFARLRPESLVRVHRADDGDEPDLDAILEAIADRRSGAPADDRLHVRRDRAARDVATAFLVDLSASTSTPVEPADPSQAVDADIDDDPLAPLWVLPEEPSEPPRRVIDVAKDAVALMSDALHQLGDRHAIYGFSGTGRHDVEFAVAKEFADRHAPNTWAAVAAMKPLRYTRMGTAVRHATAKLLAEPARTRLLIVISDGYPQDVDYGEDARDRQHGMHDTARALADAHRSGVDTFCVTIDPAGHDYLREMCPDRRYLVIDEVEALPSELAKVYLALRAR